MDNKDKSLMKKNISINLSTIGSAIQVTFCNSKEKANNGYHFDSILTEWTEPFLKEFSLSTNEEQQSRISGFFKITRTQNLYRIEGTIEFEPLLECIRSLTLFREKIRSDIHGIFVPINSQKYQQSGITKFSHQKNEENELELTEDDLETYSFQGNTIILDEVLLDHMFCSIPELPLCRENCKGLCSECGADLNEKDLKGHYQIIEHYQKCSYFKALKSH